MKTKIKLYILSAGLLLALCSCAPSVKVEIFHSPLIPTASETVDYTATVLYGTSGQTNIEIYVEGVLEKTCNNLSNGDTCTFTGGPYTAYDTISYSAKISNASGASATRGAYWFGVTTSSRQWTNSFIPARVSGPHCNNEDVVFHMAADYSGNLTQFFSDAENKIYNTYAKQDLISDPNNLDKLNFYVYTRSATVTDCGTVDTNADTDMPWRDTDAVLHIADLGDCTNLGLTHFTAEGWTTKAFLHESGHAVFGLADEYNGCLTAYFEPADEPNIWKNESDCKAEQTAKGRDPNKCWKFTSCSGGWWGIHQLGDGNVMQIGDVNDPWGIEAKERVKWYFDQFSDPPVLWCKALGVVLIPIDYRREIWKIDPIGPIVLPCDPPTPFKQGATNAPEIRVLDAEGEVLYTTHMLLDPRILLTNPPSKEPNMLEELKFNLRVPAIEGMTTLEFYLDPTQDKEPTLRVDLSEALKRYLEEGGRDQKASCQDLLFGDQK